MGFQSNRYVSENLFLRAAEPDVRHSYPLLEGRDVQAFRVGMPRLFLNPDTVQLAKVRCRLRPHDEYRRVRFVVRQTAKVPIAARHNGLPFRNSLLAGFAVPGFSAELMIGLLNSSLFRALHVSWRRDARQATFPQVKISHLRALPAPPDNSLARERVANIAEDICRCGIDAELQAALDRAVFELFELSEAEGTLVNGFLLARVPETFRIPAQPKTESGECADST
jgi:hypothetical protein